MIETPHIQCYNTGVVRDKGELVYLPFGEALRIRRQRAGITQTELAERLSSHPSRISKLESRTEPPRDRQLVRDLARELGAPVEEIFEGALRWEPTQRTIREAKSVYGPAVRAFEDFPRLEYLLNVGWSWLKPQMREHIYHFVDLVVEQARHEYTLLGGAEPEADKEADEDTG